MIGGFGDVADQIHEHQRGRPAVGGVRAVNPPVRVRPARQVLELVRDLRFAVGRIFCHPCAPRAYDRVSRYVADCPKFSSTSISTAESRTAAERSISDLTRPAR